MTIWWENTVTRGADLRSAMQAALTRTVDVDEDTGQPAPLSLPRIDTGVGTGLAATTMAIAELPVRTNPRGWELTAHPSLESRRTAGHLRELWDLAEELLVGRTEGVLLHVLGPWSVGAQVEFRGHALLQDRPAFKDVALTVGEGVRDYCARLSRSLDVPVSVCVHEPDVGRVLRGLEGATQFHAAAPVDPEIVAGVWRRFVGQVGVDCLLAFDGTVPHELLGRGVSADATAWARDFSSVAVPLVQLQESTAVKDAFGAMIGEGARVAFEVDSVKLGVASVEEIDAASAQVASDILRLWSQWTLPPELVREQAGVTMREQVRTLSQASTSAAVVRHAAANVWGN